MSKIRNIGPMPQIGFGTWQRLGQECHDCVISALETGYRHIDTAQGYQNEEFVGQAIADSTIPRKDIWLTTKVPPESFGPGAIMPSVEKSLEKLQTDQVDLLLLHWPSIKDQYDIEDYMAQFAEVFDQGLTRHIGVSNFTKHYLDRALELLGDRPLITNQCEIHVFHQNRTIVDYSASKGIPMTAYSPLARGAVVGNPVLREIGAAHDATEGQIALAFLMAEGHVVIPSSGNPQRIAENFGAGEIELNDAEMKALHALDEGRRLVNGDWCPVWDD